jgi:hypothetical protein
VFTKPSTQFYHQPYVQPGSQSFRKPYIRAAIVHHACGAEHPSRGARSKGYQKSGATVSKKEKKKMEGNGGQRVIEKGTGGE